MSHKVIINGAFGRMGQLVTETIDQADDLEVVAKLSQQDNLAENIERTKTDIVIDFTTASCAFANTEIIINAGAHPVIGTSGFLPEQITTLGDLCAEKHLGAIIAPNFSVAAVLMMKYAQDAAAYLSSVEIIEMHHDDKQDAPSGTAIKTAEMIATHNKQKPSKPCTEILPGARGATQENIHIHSIRLPGLVAHQQILFGGKGETLSIRHDSFNRECFMPGVLLACRKVLTLDHLVYGLEHVLGVKT